MTHTTETMDKLFLEISQFTKAKTGRELELERELAETKRLLAGARESQAKMLLEICDAAERKK